MSILIFISNDVNYREPKLVQAIQSQHVVVVVDSLKSKDELKSLVPSGHTFNHMAFMYHFGGHPGIPFLTEKIEQNHDQYKKKIFSDDQINFMKEMKDEHGIHVIDFITCDLNDPNFIQDASELETELGLDIRYSVDQTGNNPEGNWVLESDTINVRDIYFDSTIDTWNGVLTDAISGSAIANIEGFTSSTANGITTYTLTKNITWSATLTGVSTYTDYIQLGPNEVLDGGEYTITFPSATNGLCITTLTSNTNDSIPVIQNVNIIGNGITTTSGYIVRKSSKQVKFVHCHVNGPLNSNNGGALCGSGVGNHITSPSTSHYIIYAEQCSHIGTITGLSCGGIIGAYCGANSSGKITVRNCKHSGTIQGAYSGGIFGRNLCFNMAGTDADVLVENCISEGDVQPITYSSGIFGAYCFQNYRPTSSSTGEQQYAIVRNCLHKGDLAQGTGGILGYGCASDGANIQISQCVHIGSVATRAGGITGERFGTTSGNHWNKALNCSIDQCIQIGDVSGNWAGGLCGIWTSGQEIHITNSYVLGNISNLGSATMAHTTLNTGGAPTNAGFYVFISNIYHIGTRANDTYIVKYVPHDRGSRIHMQNIYSTPISAISGPTQTTHLSSYEYPEPTHDINTLTLGTVGTLNDNVSAILTSGRTFSYTNSGGAFTAVSGEYPILTSLTSSPWVNYSSYNSYTSNSAVDNVMNYNPPVQLTPEEIVQSYKDGTITLQEVIDEGVSLNLLLTQDVSISTILANSSSFSVSDFITEYTSGTISLSDLLSGYTLSELQSGGLTNSAVATEIGDGNITLATALGEYTVPQLKSGGVSMTTFIDGYLTNETPTLNELLQGYSQGELETDNRMENEFNPYNYITLTSDYTEGSADHTILDSAIRKWEGVITAMPSFVGSNRIQLSIQEDATLTSNVYGSTSVDSYYSDGTNELGHKIPSSATIRINPSSWNTFKTETKDDSNSKAYYLILHELGHAFGVGPVWSTVMESSVISTDSNSGDSFYVGTNGNKEYRKALGFSESNTAYALPITPNLSHLEENETYLKSGVSHIGLDHELMSEFLENDSRPDPLSRITIGLMEDLGYSVDYSKADSFELFSLQSLGGNLCVKGAIVDNSPSVGGVATQSLRPLYTYSLDDISNTSRYSGSEWALVKKRTNDALNIIGGITLQVSFTSEGYLKIKDRLVYQYVADASETPTGGSVDNWNTITNSYLSELDTSYAGVSSAELESILDATIIQTPEPSDTLIPIPNQVFTQNLTSIQGYDTNSNKRARTRTVIQQLKETVVNQGITMGSQKRLRIMKQTLPFADVLNSSYIQVIDDNQTISVSDLNRDGMYASLDSVQSFIRINTQNSYVIITRNVSDFTLDLGGTTTTVQEGETGVHDGFRYYVGSGSGELLNQPICFLKGSRIPMADGSYSNVEDLTVGDVVKTTHGSGKIIKTKQFNYPTNQEGVEPYCVDDIVVLSGNHMVKKEGRLYKAKEIGTKLEMNDTVIEYYNFQTENFIVDMIPLNEHLSVEVWDGLDWNESPDSIIWAYDRKLKQYKKYVRVI